MKKLIYILLAFAISPVFADDLNDARMAWTKKYLEQQNAPVPDGGIKIIPEKKMSHYNDFKEQRLRYKNNIEKFGYIKNTNPVSEQLRNIKITSKRDLIKHGNDFSPTSTHLKQSISDIRMAYTFNGVPNSEVDELFGFAPYLTYLKDQGWVGAIQFFRNNKIGTCAFSENNVRLSHGSIVIAQEDVVELVNGKTTTVEIMGNPSAGFVYTVEWFDNTFFRKLECENKEYSTSIKNQIVALAKKIDNN